MSLDPDAAVPVERYPEEEFEDELELSGKRNNQQSQRYSGVTDPYGSERNGGTRRGGGRTKNHHRGPREGNLGVGYENEDDDDDYDDEYGRGGDMVEYDIDTMNRVDSQDEIILDDNKSGAPLLHWLRAVCIILIVVLVMVVPFLIVYKEAEDESINASQQGDSSSSGGSGSGSYTLDVKPLPDPPSDIEDTCSLSNLQDASGYDDCSQACQVADCCEFPISLDLSCVFGNEMKCLNYHENCIRLNYPQDPQQPPQQQQQEQDQDATANNIKIPVAPLDIDILCEADRISSAAMDDNGYKICQMACEGAECCYDKDFDGPSCTEQDVCAGYAPCLALASLKKVHSEITEEVDQKCDMSNLLTAFGRDECLDTCAHALCCYAEDIVGPCPEKDNSDDFCLQYASCQNVFHVTKEQIDSLCDPNTGDEGTCMHLCFPARCCFDRGTCFDDINAPQDCDMYASCTRVFPPTDAETSSIGSINPNDSNTDWDTDSEEDEDDIDATTTTAIASGGSSGATLYSPESVRQACMNHNDYSGPGSNRKTLCEVECEPVECCFDQQDDGRTINTCNDNDNIDCSQYSICGRVYNQNNSNNNGGSGDLVQDLANACDPDVFDVDSTTCVSLCVSALCCFTLDPTKLCAVVDQDVNCQLYGACDIVYYH